MRLRFKHIPNFNSYVINQARTFADAVIIYTKYDNVSGNVLQVDVICSHIVLQIYRKKKSILISSDML